MDQGKRRIARRVGTVLRRYPGRMTSQDYVMAFYRQYSDLPDALKAYRSEKTPSAAIAGYRDYATRKLLTADADTCQLLTPALDGLRRSFPRGYAGSAKGVAAREVDEMLVDLVALYRSPRTFFKAGGRWSSHFGGELLLVRLRRGRGRAATQILGRIARRWGGAPFKFNKDLERYLDSASPMVLAAVARLVRKFEAAREAYSDGRRAGSKDSRPRLTTGHVKARNLEVDVETRATKGSDLDRDGAGNQAEAIRRVAARRGEKPDTVKKGLMRDR